MLTACVSANDTPASSQAVTSHNTAVDDVVSAAPARDGNIAIIEEFEAAKAKNTVQSYGLFIARHPEHALTQHAKELRETLKTEQISKTK